MNAKCPLDIRHTRISDSSQLEEYYLIKEKLGEGSFGIVRKVKCNENSTIWACKAINKEKAGSSKIKLLEREVDILKNVRHDHIIQLHEVFESPKKMFLIMEFCIGGELADHLKQQKFFDEEDTKIIILRIANAVAYLHKKGMVHRDLKLENILLAQNPLDSKDKLYIKVTDFGLSVIKGVGHEDMMTDYCGTRVYMAPEIIDNKNYSEMCDIWALGVIMYWCIAGHSPFYKCTQQNLDDNIKTFNIREHLVTVDERHVSNLRLRLNNLSENAKECMCSMFLLDPAYRLTANEIQDHVWISGHKRPPNVLEMMKQFNSIDANTDSIETTNKPSTPEMNQNSSASRSNSKKSLKKKKVPTATLR